MAEEVIYTPDFPLTVKIAFEAKPDDLPKDAAKQTYNEEIIFNDFAGLVEVAQRHLIVVGQSKARAGKISSGIVSKYTYGEKAKTGRKTDKEILDSMSATDVANSIAADKIEEAYRLLMEMKAAQIAATASSVPKPEPKSTGRKNN